MKPVIFRYGLYGALLMIALSAVHFFLFMPNVNYQWAEVGGYLTMLLSMIFVFLGIRYYRDNVNGGALSFGQGMKLGILIALIPAVFFGLFDILYTEVINPSWLNDYYSEYVTRLKNSTPPDQLQAQLDKMESEKAIFANPIFQFLLMTATVFIIGLIVTIISSIALRRSKSKPA